MRIIRYLYYFLLFFSCISCDTISEELVKENSPLIPITESHNTFLQQHIDNPIHWNTWNDGAISKAIDSDRLIIISLGYASCHWCHVMEKESFMDTEVAEIMNSNYISVLVDKEERPDLNKLFLDIAVMINGNGGWPLNVICLPNGKPIFAGSYFYKNEWINLLTYYNELYNNDKNTLVKQADEIANNIKSLEYLPPKITSNQILESDIKICFNNLIQSVDFNLGGQKQPFKFPLPMVWEYLLDYYSFSKNDSSLSALTITLDKMSQGGIYDHIESGFFRYATDQRWKVPHFEKMLYDNALLCKLYSRAYKQTKSPRYKAITLQVLNFLDHEMKSPDGYFYSTIDAETNHQEGDFYSWKESEIDSLLQEDAYIFKDLFGILKIGNWKKGRNIIFYEDPLLQIAKRHNISSEKIQTQVANNFKTLKEYRQQRTAPEKDKKALTEWNALMIDTYIEAYKTFNSDSLKDKAISIAKFITENMLEADGSILRVWNNDSASVKGFLSDYSTTACALVNLYDITLDSTWLKQASLITDYTINHFYNPETGLFFYTPDTDSIYVFRQQSIRDVETPSSNSQTLYALNRLYLLTGNSKYEEIADRLLFTMKDEIISFPIIYASWAQHLLNHFNPPFEITISGNKIIEARKEFNKYRLHNVIFHKGDAKEKSKDTSITLCKGKVCFAKFNTVEEAINSLTTFQ